MSTLMRVIHIQVGEDKVCTHIHLSLDFEDLSRAAQQHSAVRIAPVSAGRVSLKSQVAYVGGLWRSGEDCWKKLERFRL